MQILSMAAVVGLAVCACSPAYTSKLFTKFSSPFVRYVCNGSKLPGKIKNGVVGRLWFDEATDSIGFNSLTDAFQPHLRTEYAIYTDGINEPPRSFTEGFSLWDTLIGQQYLLNREDGSLLLTNYGIHFEANIKALPGQAGHYSFATVSDDAIRLAIDDNVIVENNTNHPPTANCQNSNTSVYIDEAGSTFEAWYMQGPPDTIASSVLWRKETGPTHPTPGFCGAAYLPDLNIVEDEGYELVAPVNFFVPAKYNSYNPCNEK